MSTRISDISGTSLSSSSSSSFGTNLHREMLKHRTIYTCEEDIAVKLPLTDALRAYHENGDFPLLENPNDSKRTVIIGMFVLRPGLGKAVEGDVLDSDGYPRKIYDEDMDWVYNLDGIDGGWLIANLNSVDAYRLGMQYGVSDAVMVGSNTVCAEGISTSDRLGYIWQPYGPLEWPSVKSIDDDMVNKVAELRRSWQKLGFLSNRTYPAQIVISHSGMHFPNSPDFLSARVFNEFHPNGERIEAYILTTEIGAKRIRDRCAQFHLEDRIEEMLIILPSLSDNSEKLDLSTLSSLLYEKYSMKIVNHDGGQKILREFSAAHSFPSSHEQSQTESNHLPIGVLTQMNLTLGRKWNLKEVLKRISCPMISEEKRTICLNEFETRIHYFFSSPTSNNSNQQLSFHYHNGIPRNLKISSCIEDDEKDVLIGVFNTKHGFNFYESSY